MGSLRHWTPSAMIDVPKAQGISLSRRGRSHGISLHVITGQSVAARGARRLSE